MKFEFMNTKVNDIEVGDIILTETDEKLLVIVDTYEDYAVINLDTMLLELKDFGYMSELLEEINDHYTVKRIIKNKNLLIKEQQETTIAFGW